MYNLRKHWINLVLLPMVLSLMNNINIVIAAKNCPAGRSETGFHQANQWCDWNGEGTAGTGSKAPLPFRCPEGRFQNFVRRLKVVMCLDVVSLKRNGWIDEAIYCVCSLERTLLIVYIVLKRFGKIGNWLFKHLGL